MICISPFVAAAGVLFATALIASGATPLLAQGQAVRSPIAPELSTGGACVPTAVKYKTAADTVSTGSGSFVDVPNGTMKIIQGRLGCITVAFSAEARVDVAIGMELRAQLNDTFLCDPPGEGNVGVNFTSATGFEARAMNFVCPDVPAGTYTLNVQYRPVNGGNAFLRFRSLIVHHMK